MIVDIHGHTNAPPSLYAYKAGLLASKGAHGKGNPGINPDQLALSCRTPPLSGSEGASGAGPS